MIVDKDIIKICAMKLNNYTNMKNEIIDIEERIINSSSTSLNGWIKSKNSNISVVENQAIALADNKEIKKLKKWISIIDNILEYFKDDETKIKIIKYKYLDSLPVKDIIIINRLIEENNISENSNERKYYLIHKEQIFYKMEQLARANGVL